MYFKILAILFLIWKEIKMNIIEGIGRILSKKILPTIGIATLIASTAIGLILPAFEAGVWRRRANMPTPRWLLSTAVVNGKIYVIGGLTVNAALSTVEEYDPVTDTWTKKASMPTPRGNLSTVVVDNKIYAIGGATDVNVLSTVEEYDPITDTWTKKAPMPMARQGLSITAVNGKIYAIGGATDVNVLSTVEEYNPTADTWTRKANMPTKRVGLSTSAVSGKIYAIGGWIPPRNIGKALETVEIYDPVEDK